MGFSWLARRPETRQPVETDGSEWFVADLGLDLAASEPCGLSGPPDAPSAPGLGAVAAAPQKTARLARRAGNHGLRAPFGRVEWGGVSAL